MDTPLMRSIATGGAIVAAILFTTVAPQQAQARYWELVCRGPIAAMTADGRQVVLEARAGIRANRPRRGECVWRDRPMNRAGEHVSGRIRLVLPSRARITGLRRLGNGGLSFRMPGHPQVAELAGFLFSPVASPVVVHARRVGSGVYIIRLGPVPRAVPRAVPAPGYRGGRP